MSKTLVETVNAHIDELLAQRDSEIAAAEQALNEAKEAVATAKNSMDTAISAADVSGYATAHEGKVKAEMAVEVYAARLAQLKEKQFVTDDENASVMLEIRAAQKDLMNDASSKIVALLAQVEDIGKLYFAGQDALNELVWRWHREIRNQEHPRISGRIADTSDLYAPDESLRTTIVKFATNGFYRDWLGIDQYHGTGPIWTK